MYNPNLHFHFVGIGGTGMAGIAEVLLNQGFAVSGSDTRDSEVCSRLRGLGAGIAVGHATENVPAQASLVVYSSAVTLDNPGVVEAKRRRIPVVRRAEVLAELMRLKFSIGVAGSHGKTTTTSLTAAVLEAGGIDPTVIIGGQVRARGTGAKLGKGQFLVAETDESDRSFLLLRPTIAVVTNIDNEHLQAYKSRDDLDLSFEQFVNSVPFYGLAVLCWDDPTVRTIAARVERRIITYGEHPEADLRLIGATGAPEGMKYRVELNGKDLGEFVLPMFGKHFALNSLAAIAVGLECGVAIEQMREGLKEFSGVRRRLELAGTVDGVTVINDYGHHPTEIVASIRGVRECLGATANRLYAIFQPHRYSRTVSCWTDFLTAFEGVDKLLVTDIYAAGERPLAEISSDRLTREIEVPDKRFVPTLEEALDIVAAEVVPGDVVLCLGAGSIGSLPEKLVTKLEERTSSGVHSAPVAVSA